MTKSSFKSKSYTSKEVLEIVHTNLCGPIEVQSYKGDIYIMMFVDDYFRMMTIMFLKHKSDAFQMFKYFLLYSFIVRIKPRTEIKITCKYNQ